MLQPKFKKEIEKYGDSYEPNRWQRKVTIYFFQYDPDTKYIDKLTPRVKLDKEFEDFEIEIEIIKREDIYFN